MKLENIPIADRLYKDPEKLEPADKSAILEWLRLTVSRYRSLRLKMAQKERTGLLDDK